MDGPVRRPARVYPSDVDGLALRLVTLAADAYREREPELSRLDLVRTLEPDWLQSPEMLGYAAYADRFAGDLAGVRERIPYLQELGVRYLHLMPLLLPREGDSDGGYAVADYRAVRPDLGTIEDLRALAPGRRVGLPPPPIPAQSPVSGRYLPGPTSCCAHGAH